MIVCLHEHRRVKLRLSKWLLDNMHTGLFPLYCGFLVFSMFPLSGGRGNVMACNFVSFYGSFIV